MWGRAELPVSAASTLTGAYQSWALDCVTLLTGVSVIYPLSQVWQVQLVRRGFTIHNIDCAMRFDTYNIAEEALRNEIAPESIADAIFVSRAFTPYQILDALYGLLEKGRSVSTGEKKVYFILAPSKQFFDGDVAFDEGLYLLEQLVEVIKKINQRKIALAIVEHQGYNHPVFQSVFPRLAAVARPVFSLSKPTQKDNYLLQVKKAGLRGQRHHRNFIREEGNHGQNSFSLFDGDRKSDQPVQNLPQSTA